MDRALTHYRRTLLVASILGFATIVSSAASAQTDAPAAQPTVADELALSQSDLADRFDRLEKLMLRMAEFDQATNPRRSETLKEAYSLSKEQQIRLQLESVMRLLNQDNYRRAITNQETVITDLRQLLKVLEAENRGDRLKDDQARVREYIKEVERLQRMQRSVRGRTEGGISEGQAAEEQDQVAKRTGALNERIQENEGRPGASESDAPSSENGSQEGGSPEDAEGSEGKSSEGDSEDSDSENEEGSAEGEDAGESQDRGENEPQSQGDTVDEGESAGQQGSDGESSDGESNDGKPSDGEPDGGKPDEGSNGQPAGENSPNQESAGEQKQPSGPSSESQPGEGQPSQGQPSQGQSQQGQSGGESGEQDQSPPPEAFPGQQQIQQAQQQMQQAKQALDEAKRDEAVERQKEAAKKLAEAKARLEEILRQMREEEIERTLAQLESRFQKMLEMQLRVNERTLQLAELTDDRVLEIESSKLSFQEKRIVVEADKALTLLREEGSSVAFPETVDQMRDDMQQVVDRLARVQLGPITQGLEDDIVQSLEEMIEALQMAQKEQEERKANPQQNAMQQGTPGDMPLVNAIAELKMIKALQLRVNKRTNRYAQLLDDVDDPAGQANDEELVEALRGLAQRELRVQEITHDIAIGKNK